MNSDRPDYSSMSHREILDCWQWIDDIRYPDRAIELYQRVYAERDPRSDTSTSDGLLSSIFGLLAGSTNFGRFALEMEVDRLESELRLKKGRVEKLIAERQAESLE